MKAKGNAFLSLGYEPESSFVLHLDHDLIDILMETHPEAFWKTPHDEGHPVVLVRIASPDDDLVREMIGRARAKAAITGRNRPNRDDCATRCKPRQTAG